MRLLLLVLVGALVSGCQETIAAWNDCKSSSMGFETVSQDTIEVEGQRYFLIDRTWGLGGSYSTGLISDESAYAADWIADLSSFDTLDASGDLVWRLQNDTLQVMKAGLGPASFGGLAIAYVEPSGTQTHKWFAGNDPDGWQWVNDCF